MSNIVRKQGLIIECNLFLKREEQERVRKSIMSQLKETGVAFLPSGFSVKTVDMDYALVDGDGYGEKE